MKRSFVAARTTSLDRSRTRSMNYPGGGGGPGGIGPLQRSESMSAVPAVRVPGSEPVGENSRAAIRDSGGVDERRHAMQAEESPLLSDLARDIPTIIAEKQVLF